MIDKWDPSGTFMIKANPVWTLTGRLRWVKRGKAGSDEKVFQQEWSDPYAGSKWIDVPEGEEQRHQV